MCTAKGKRRFYVIAAWSGPVIGMLSKMRTAYALIYSPFAAESKSGVGDLGDL